MNSKDELQTISTEENNSEFDVFCEKLRTRLECYYGENYSVTISPINKNNGTIRHALLIREDGCNITPSIYIDCYYDEYKEGKSFADVIREIIDIRNSSDIMPEFDIEFIRDYEAVKRKLGMKLINKELNKEMLNCVPYEEFADMVVVFFIMVTEYTEGEASILIRNELFKEWDISVERLYKDALDNMMRCYPPVKMDMIDVLGDMLLDKMKNCEECNTSEINDFMDEMKRDMCGNRMYVLSNQAKWYGAVSMVYTDMLRCLADSFGTDYYILPSSIHEVILVPDTDSSFDHEFLTKMVREVNESEIRDDEILSDHAYKYHRVNNWVEPLK